MNAQVTIVFGIPHAIHCYQRYVTNIHVLSLTSVVDVKEGLAGRREARDVNVFGGWGGGGKWTKHSSGNFPPTLTTTTLIVSYLILCVTYVKHSMHVHARFTK